MPNLNQPAVIDLKNFAAANGDQTVLPDARFLMIHAAICEIWHAAGEARRAHVLSLKKAKKAKK